MVNGRPNETSVFEHRTIEDIYEEICEVYLNYPHPWVIGYSGGKDSTAVLQLVWYALERLPVEQRRKPIYVISTNTLVETPVIIDYIKKTLDSLEKYATERNMPFMVGPLKPTLDDTFWVNLIGRGYPAPNNIFRWCTERLKINPSNRFISNLTVECGEVILVLGMRSGESGRRDRAINMHRYHWHVLSRHGRLRDAWVYMPIEDFSVDDIWTFLLQIPSPWGGDNRDLASLYRSGQDGECPLVVDDTIPPCGNSRFGCWTCTVVDRDRSMEAMIDSGEEWMIPLLDYRDYLASTQDPTVKPKQREYKGRDGRVRVTDKGLRWRTYTLEMSQEMLRRLLEAQIQIQKHDPTYRLISNAELKEIRRLWLTERGDWADSLPSIHEEVTSLTLDWDYNDVSMPGQLELALLRRIAPKYDIPVHLPQKLIDAEWQYYGMRRRGLIHKTIENILNEDWRTLEEIQAEITLRHRQTDEPMKIV